MKSFSKDFLKNLKLNVSTSWLMSQCSEAKGKQVVWELQRPELLAALREMAMIQSVESSNRIEGVEVEARRLKPLLMGKLTPKDRPEEEVIGYRRALKYLLSKKNLEANSLFVRKLHAFAQEGASDAGKWKRKDNEIIEIDQRGNRKIRYKAVSAKDTAKFMDLLSGHYNEELQQEKNPELLLVALYVLDFLCVHPFRDGNGRVSRLITLALLNQQGFTVGKWISLERLVEERKEDYYEALKKSSAGWQEGKHDVLPWLNFFMSILRQAYKEFAARMEHASKEIRGKGELIQQIIFSQESSFSLRELRLQLPGVSEQMIKKILNDAKKDKKILLQGKGRGARWHLK
jgi:Fic family protein